MSTEMKLPKPDHLAPGPFDYETTANLSKSQHHGMGHVYLVDANGRKIASIWGPPDTKLATVKLILDAREKFDD